MKTKTHPGASALTFLALSAVSGCGIEGLITNAGAVQYRRPVSLIQGTTPFSTPAFSIVNGDGNKVDILRYRLNGSDFELQVPSAPYDNIRVRAVQGAAMLSGIVSRVEVDGTAGDVNLDSLSTTITLITEARLGVEAKTLQEVTPPTLRVVVRSIVADAAMLGPAQTLRTMVDRIVSAAQTSTAGMAFKQVATSTAGKVTQSALDAQWLATVMLDYDGDGARDLSTAAFDAALEAAVAKYNFLGCPDPNKIRLVFAVDFNQGSKDGNCDVIQRFRWVTDKPGKQMYFVGGIHKESALQDPELDAAMSNIGGGWVPNQVPMYDDGTNGDAVAGDNVWTITFSVPRGARFGYKYTWGLRGDLWTGAEEWPGNQRVLEAVDENGDNFIYRLDAFGDEATNKDKVNLFRRGMGTVTWDTDANRDGIPDPRERKLDTNNDCTLDNWVTPKGVPPVTVDCE